MRTKVVKTKAHNEVIFNSLFSSQVTCQDLLTNKKKQTGHRHPDYRGKKFELRK